MAAQGGRGRQGGRRLIGRVFSVLCALGLVGGFAIAALAPPGLPLGAALLDADAASLRRLHAAVVWLSSEAIWRAIAVPLLLRPAWLLPAMVGLVSGGLAYTLGETGPTRRRP